MELQGLQEALKVEIQCHEKLAVRSCPVGTPAKPLSLIKPSSQSIAISVVPAKAPVSMVTAHINGQKAANSDVLQTSPINLQTANRTHRPGELCHSQMLGTLTAVPIKVPQVSSLHRLAGQSPTVLPQVRPKTLIPDSLPHSPCQEQQSSQPLSLARGGAAAVISPKSQGLATFSPARMSSHQGEITPPPLPVPSVSTATASPGVAYAIISATSSPTNGVAAMGEAVKVQPLIFSPDSKVIIIQPQIASSSLGSPGPQAQISSQEPSPAPSPLHKSNKKEEDPEKIAFMVALGLVTTEHLEEIQTKRQERKRRSTANPAYSLFDPERKRLASNYLNNPLFLSARDSEELCWKEELEHDEHCAVCKEEGNLQQCHSCTRAYHLDCLHPPLKSPPKGMWMCPKCQKKVLNKENLSWPHNFVQSYVTHKTVREEEKRRLMRRNSELKKECAHLKEEDQRLNKSLLKCRDVKERLLSQQRETQASLERLRALIRLIQRDQMIQVTMTATTTTSGGAALLSLPWIKPSSTSSTSSSTAPPAGPSALLHKSVLHSQGNN